MRLFILSLFISGFCYGQKLDTVYVRNLTLQAQDLAWVVGKYSFNDSAELRAFRKIRTVVQSNIPQNWTTNVTVDSLPGKVVLGFYQLAKTSGAGEIAARYTAITNAISAKTNLSYWIGFIDGNIQADFDRFRDKGKNRLIDQ